MNTITPGVEPLNIIISVRSTVPLDAILAALKGWDWVFTGVTYPKCLSAEQANVAGSYVTQKWSWRLGGCITGNILSLTGKENHARLWNQPVPGSQTGAWFISASYETLCINTTAGLEPRNNAPDRHISGPWHCIDGGKGSYGANGYDNGSTALVEDLTLAASEEGWYAAVRIDPRPAGTGEDGVPFSGAVAVVTIDYTPIA